MDGRHGSDDATNMRFGGKSLLEYHSSEDYALFRLELLSFSRSLPLSTVSVSGGTFGQFGVSFSWIWVKAVNKLRFRELFD